MRILVTMFFLFSVHLHIVVKQDYIINTFLPLASPSYAASNIGKYLCPAAISAIRAGRSCILPQV